MPASPEGIRRALEPHPMPQLPLFSEQSKKRIGMKIAADNNAEILETFRNIAKHQASIKGIISIDDVRKGAEINGVEYHPGAWVGSVFKGDEWVCVGVVAATHEGSHGRLVRTWRRK